MDAPSLKALASHLLCHYQEEGPAECLCHKAMWGVECWTDHCLIVSKLKIYIQPKRRPQGVKAPKRLNVKLKEDTVKQSLTSTMEERLESLVLDNQNVKAPWGTLRDVPRPYLKTAQGLV